jgi:membrane protein YqaA with SNARE-associated domain
LIPGRSARIDAFIASGENQPPFLYPKQSWYIAVMLNALIQSAVPPQGLGITSVLGHLGALGLFFVAIIDSSPLPTFGGPDILTAFLAARQTNPWFEFVAVATAGSVIGAYLTFRIARKAGSAFLHSKFGNRKVNAMFRFFEKWGTGGLVASTAIPFPFPTSFLFAAAGASKYSVARFLTVVTICRAARYTLVALIADHYGRHFVRVLLHPAKYWGWLLLFGTLILGVILAGIMLNKRLAATSAA